MITLALSFDPSEIRTFAVSRRYDERFAVILSHQYGFARDKFGQHLGDIYSEGEASTAEEAFELALTSLRAKVATKLEEMNARTALPAMPRFSTTRPEDLEGWYEPKPRGPKMVTKYGSAKDKADLEELLGLIGDPS